MEQYVFEVYASGVGHIFKRIHHFDQLGFQALIQPGIHIGRGIGKSVCP